MTACPCLGLGFGGSSLLRADAEIYADTARNGAKRPRNEKGARR
jgi:hypothetical protein